MFVSFIIFLITLIFYYPLKKIAPFFKLIDFPDGKLKKHDKPIPHIGGIMIYSGFILGVIIEILLLKFPYYSLYKGVLVSGLFILFLGILDDIYKLDWFVKLIGEIILAIILISYNIKISFTFVPEWVNIVLTIIWFVFIVNAYNLIDVSDGVSGFIFLIFLSTAYVLSFITGNEKIMILIFPLIGSSLAFLTFNYPKAKIFAGDGGSLFMGFMVGLITISISFSKFNPYAIFTPFLLNFYPIFEVTLLIISRLNKGLSPFLGSPHHFPIRLKKIGFSSEKVLITIIIIQITYSFSSYLMVIAREFYPIFIFGLGIITGIILLLISLKTGDS